MAIEGPFGAARPEDSASLRKVFSCRPATAAEEAQCANEIISNLARKAFRRPVSAGDLEQLVAFYEVGRSEGGFDDGIELALRRLLASPQFLVRVEREPSDVAPGQAYRISGLELASIVVLFMEQRSR